MFDLVRALPAELLELVWGSLRAPEAARARAVCRAWAGAIDGSPAVRRKTRHCKRFCNADRAWPPSHTAYDWSLERIYWEWAWMHDFDDLPALVGCQGEQCLVSVFGACRRPDASVLACTSRASPGIKRRQLAAWPKPGSATFAHSHSEAVATAAPQAPAATERPALLNADRCPGHHYMRKWPLRQ